MDSPVQCPKCHSTSLSAQKRGFSGGKAVAGAVLTGGVGLLAGLHGKDKLAIYCMNCGHSWDPAQRAKERAAQQKPLHEGYTQTWKAAFYNAYENDNKAEAESILRVQRSAMLVQYGLDATYKKLKAEDQGIGGGTVFLGIAFIALICLLLYWLF